MLQFPLWWHGMPAILKGWFDRVFVQGFAFGVTDGRDRTLRYGEGNLAGKRALVVTTAGARGTGMGARGLHGDTEQLLFPLLHGTLWYTGMPVLPPLLIPRADRLTPGRYEPAAALLRERLRGLATDAPIPYRRESGGDYDADLVLRPHLEPGRTGLHIHTGDRPARRDPAPARTETAPTATNPAETNPARVSGAGANGARAEGGTAGETGTAVPAAC
ncbi:NAD(P)H-dependent oxidoreductase [Actinomadura sp. 21ATH]|uniref:NAD(P)H-dependent oxidoreductase n=1 Tax=Actinomadura sp. 21ATH TaxID=1735444 RepID=UPI0035C22129